MSTDFDINKVLSWSTRDLARKYIGEKCYLEDTISELKEVVKDDMPETLKSIDDDNRDAFVNSVGQEFGFCYPKEIKAMKPDTNGKLVASSMNGVKSMARKCLLSIAFEDMITNVEMEHYTAESTFAIAIAEGLKPDLDDLLLDLTCTCKRVSYLLTKGVDCSIITVTKVDNENSSNKIEISFTVKAVDRDTLVGYLLFATDICINDKFNSQEN